MFNLRGKIVLVVDLHIVFGIPKQESEHVIIAEAMDNSIAILVDSVTEIIRVPKTDIKKEPAPVLKKISEAYLKGVVTIKDRLIIYLDLLKVLSENELSELSSLAKAFGKNKKEDK